MYLHLLETHLIDEIYIYDLNHILENYFPEYKDEDVHLEKNKRHKKMPHLKK